jgi:pyruvate formate lyase activating enzyme
MVTGRIHSFESCGTVDGPGIRCVVFLQGCPLRCLYCHNADTWKFGEGKEMTVAEVLDEVRKYKSYMRFSGGGMTLSGGEPLSQPEFAEALFRACRKEGIRTALDTSGHAPWDKAAGVVDASDVVLLDLKCIDPDGHRTLTRVGLDWILEFARRVSDAGRRMRIRHVLVPRITDDQEHLEALGKFIASLETVDVVEVLPFHKLGEHKWRELGLEYELKNVQPPGPEDVRRAIALLSRHHPDVR